MGFIKTTRLIRRAQSGDNEAAQELWLNNARLCYSVANSINIREDLVADLIQESQESFAKAIRNFDIERLHEFSTYAYAAIRSHMFRALPKIRFSTKIPTQLYKPLNHFNKRLAHAPDRSQWFDEREMMIEQGTYTAVCDLHAIAIPRPIEFADSAMCKTLSPDQHHSKCDLLRHLKHCIDQLEYRDQFVLAHRYGLCDTTELTLQQIGDMLGLTRERVRQIQLLAEKKLRDFLEGNQSPDSQQSAEENPIMRSSMIEVKDS